jgi:hypothetical protein
MISSAKFRTKLRRKPFVVNPSVKADVCVIGDDGPGLAIASLMAHRGASVSIVKVAKKSKASEENDLFNLKFSEEKSSKSSLRWSEHRESLDAIRAKVVEPTKDLAEARFVILPGNGTAYSGYVSLVRKYLRDGQNLILLNAPIGAGLQFRHLLRTAGIDRKFNIVEVGSIFDSVQLDGDKIVVGSIKCRASIAGNTRNQLRTCMHLDAFLPAELIPSSNVLERGFCETERLLRPALLSFALLGATADVRSPSKGIGKTKFKLETSSIGSQAVINLLEKLEREVCCLASAFKAVPPSLLIALEDGGLATMKTRGKLLLTAMMRRIRFENTVFIKALSRYYEELINTINATANPTQTARWLINKDIVENGTVVADLARLAHLQTPILDSVIDLAAGITNCDLRAKGRHLSDLGLTGYNLNEVIELVNA